MPKNSNNYKTPQEKLEELLQEIESDLNANNHDVACEQLSKIGEQHQALLESVSNLYHKFLTLQRRC
jgi:outer membrane protein assembly factor BamD (BamD/ComL family)